MPCSGPELPQAAAYFSSPNNPDLHSIFVPNRLVKGFVRAGGFGCGRYGKISVGLFVPASQYFLLSVTIAFAYGGVGRSASVSANTTERRLSAALR